MPRRSSPKHPERVHERPPDPAEAADRPLERKESDDVLPRADENPHHVLNNPVGEPDPTEWPDPYEQRDDPRDPVGPEEIFGEQPHAPTGATSTSQPHPDQDPEAIPAEGPKRDKLDE